MRYINCVNNFIASDAPEGKELDLRSFRVLWEHAKIQIEHVNRLSSLIFINRDISEKLKDFSHDLHTAEVNMEGLL